MKTHRMNSTLASRILIYALLVLFAASVILPFLNIIAVSLSSAGPVSRGEVTIFPKSLTFHAYGVVAKNDSLWSAYKNTFFVVAVGTVSCLFMTVLAAYPVSKKTLPGRRWIMFLIMLTMWFSGGMIPTFLVVRKMGLYNSLFALFVPVLVSAFDTIVLRNYFETIPESLEESAKMDGAGDFLILFRIYLPLCTPVLATVALWLAVGLWNSFFAPLIYLNERSKYTVQVVLRDIVLANAGFGYGMDIRYEDDLAVIPESIRNATILFSTIPILLIYPFLQRYFIKGVLIGAVKG